jgi:hypothetical protein
MGGEDAVVRHGAGPVHPEDRQAERYAAISLANLDVRQTHHISEAASGKLDLGGEAAVAVIAARKEGIEVTGTLGVLSLAERADADNQEVQRSLLSRHSLWAPASINASRSS